MTTKDLAYLAGFLDGEGCLSTVIREVRRNGRALRNIDIVLVITNTHLGVLKWIRKVVGAGRIHEQKYEKNRKTRCWRFVLDAHTMLPLLRRILPHLKVKNRQAELAIQYLESRARRPKRSLFNDAEIRAVFQLRLETQRVPGNRIRYRDREYSLQEFKKMLLKDRDPSRYRVIEWTPEMDSHLGKAPDGKVAKKLKVSRSQIQKRRSSLKIPPYTTTRTDVPTYW